MVKEATNITDTGYALDARQNNTNISNSLRALVDAALVQTSCLREYGWIKKSMWHNENFDDYMEPGTYICNNDSIIVDIANRPLDKSGRLEVKQILGNDAYIHQLYFPYQAHLGIYLRTRDFSVGWSKWYHIAAE